MIKGHVALLHYTALPIVGGVESVTAYHARALIDAGYSVTVLTGRGGTDSTMSGAKVVAIPELDSEHAGNRQMADALEHGSVLRRFEPLRHCIEERLAPICAEADLVIVHSIFNMHFNLPLTAALHGLLDRHVARHLVAWCHDISRYVNLTSGEDLRFGFPWNLLRTYRPDVRYVAVSPQRQRTLASVLGCDRESIRVVPNGVDPAALVGLSDMGRHLTEEFHLTESDVIMLMPTRITRAKNIKRSLQVVAAIKELGSRPKLVVTGPPDPHSHDGQLCLEESLNVRKNLDLAQEVEFVYLGTRRYPRPLILRAAVVGELYRLCDLVLLTSDREGFGMPVLEGALVDKPVFTTAVPNLEQVGGEWVYLIEADESAAQVALRITTWATQDSAHRLRRRVRQDFTWSAIFLHSIEPLIAERLGLG